MAEQKQYCGSGKRKDFDNGGYIIKVGLRVSDLPQPNEKGYVNIVVAPRLKPDQYGNDFSVYVDTWKPEKKQEVEPEPKKPTSYDLPF